MLLFMHLDIKRILGDCYSSDGGMRSTECRLLFVTLAVTVINTVTVWLSKCSYYQCQYQCWGYCHQMCCRNRGGHQDERKPGDASQIPHQTENPFVGHRRSRAMYTGVAVWQHDINFSESRELHLQDDISNIFTDELLELSQIISPATHQTSACSNNVQISY